MPILVLGQPFLQNRSNSKSEHVNIIGSSRTLQGTASPTQSFRAEGEKRVMVETLNAVWTVPRGHEGAPLPEAAVEHMGGRGSLRGPDVHLSTYLRLHICQIELRLRRLMQAALFARGRWVGPGVEPASSPPSRGRRHGHC